MIRVFTRLRAIKDELNPAVEKRLWGMAKSLVDPVSPGNFNQALMELGATVCKPVNPDCSVCPARAFCVAHELVNRRKDMVSNLFDAGLRDIEDLAASLPENVDFFPRKPEKKKPKDVYLSVIVLTIANKETPEFLLMKRPSKGLLANQLEFPSIAMDQIDEKATFPEKIVTNANLNYLSKLGFSLDDRLMSSTDESSLALFRRFPGCVDAVLPSAIVHVFSHQRHTMRVHVLEVNSVESESGPWLNKIDGREVKDFNPRTV